MSFLSAKCSFNESTVAFTLDGAWAKSLNTEYVPSIVGGLENAKGFRFSNVFEKEPPKIVIAETKEQAIKRMTDLNNKQGGLTPSQIEEFTKLGVLEK